MIDSRPSASGDGGHVRVQAEALTLKGGSYPQRPVQAVVAMPVPHGASRDLALTDGARISGSASGTGQGGTVSVLARDTLTLAAGGLIAANSLSAQGGAAGSIQVEAGTLTLTGGAQIVSSTAGAGQGGTVSVLARDTLMLAGQDRAENRSGVFARAREGSSGNAGALTVEAGTLTLTDGAQISACVWAPAGGTVSVLARDTLTLAAGA